MPGETTDGYLIWSVEHRMWWRWGASGYTARVSEAGLYIRSAAMNFCKLKWFQQLPDDIPVLLDDVKAFMVDRLVADGRMAVPLDPHPPMSTPAPTPMRCGECGRHLGGDTTHCMTCGAKL